ncbi:hypothetical protein ACO22_03162, partial [Paracoccidioides brasiliensis]
STDQLQVSLEEFRQTIHSDKNYVYNELAAIFDSIFDDEKALRDIVTCLQMEQNDAAAQTAIKQSQTNELIAEWGELSHILVHMTVSYQATSQDIILSKNTRRSVKIDDSKHLTDNKTSKFEHWLSCMKNKL